MCTAFQAWFLQTLDLASHRAFTIILNAFLKRIFYNFPWKVQKIHCPLCQTNFNRKHMFTFRDQLPDWLNLRGKDCRIIRIAWQIRFCKLYGYHTALQVGDWKQSILGMHFVMHGIYCWSTCKITKWKGAFDVSNIDLRASNCDGDSRYLDTYQHHNVQGCTMINPNVNIISQPNQELLSKFYITCPSSSPHPDCPHSYHNHYWWWSDHWWLSGLAWMFQVQKLMVRIFEIKVTVSMKQTHFP